MTTTVYRLRRSTAYSPLGDPPAEEPERIPLPGAVVSPRSGGEDEGSLSDEIHGRNRQGIVQALSLWVPADADIRHTDEIEVDGLVFSVEAEPNRWVSPITGWPAGAIVPIRRAAG